MNSQVDHNTFQSGQTTWNIYSSLISYKRPKWFKSPSQYFCWFSNRSLLYICQKQMNFPDYENKRIRKLRWKLWQSCCFLLVLHTTEKWHTTFTKFCFIKPAKCEFLPLFNHTFWSYFFNHLHFVAQGELPMSVSIFVTPCAKKGISFLLSVMPSPSWCPHLTSTRQGTLPLSDMSGKLSSEGYGGCLA